MGQHSGSALVCEVKATIIGAESNVMTETMAAWSAPECPFKIEYATDVLEDIRLAVMDAFFSLPRGGAEIGGVLLGRHERGRVVVTDSVALGLEHAFGP